MFKKSVLFGFGFLVLFQLFAQEKKELPNDSILSWNNTIKLKWADFEGELNPNVFAYAVTSYKIDIIPENVKVDKNDNIQNYEQLTVVASFYKKQSWTVSSNIELLKHEQLHFDIAELFARKIRKRYSELKSTKQKAYSTYWKEYSLLWKECREMQKQYDSETNHGANNEKNLNWNVKIAASLEALENF